MILLMTLTQKNSDKDDAAITGTPIDNTSQVQHIAHYDIVTYQCTAAKHVTPVTTYYFQYNNRNTILTTNGR
jgi:hypothetical protein